MASKNFSVPAIRTTNPKKWYIEFYYKVPPPLRKFYDRSSKRFKMYGDINSYPMEDRMRHAEILRSDWEYNLTVLSYNPFEVELEALEKHEEKLRLEQLSEEEKMKLIPVTEAMKLFLASKVGEVDDKTVTTYGNTVNWLTDYFVSKDLADIPVSEVTRLHLAEAVKKARKDRKWKSNTTYNKEVEFSMTIFNWFETEEYILKNPGAGKIKKLRTSKKKHKWYDKDEARIAIDAIVAAGRVGLLRACQFTYWLMVRSKKELRMLRVADIDQTLRRVRFSPQLSKNDKEEYRDYPAEFQEVLDGMNLSRFPKTYFLFGTGGLPGPTPCAHNTFSKQWEKIRKSVGLSEDHTVYAWKHTRIIHMMMLGIDGYQISYMARHENIKTTDDYKRDYDYTLVNKYGPEDLTFKIK